MPSSEPPLVRRAAAIRAAETGKVPSASPIRTPSPLAAEPPVSLFDFVEHLGGIAQQVFWLASSNRDRLLYVSPAVEQIWGRSADLLRARPQLWLDSIHPDDRARVAPMLRQGQSYDVEYRIVRPDGSERWVRERGLPLPAAAGQPERMAGVAEDVSPRKHCEHERERLVRLIEHSRDFIAMADAKGRVTYLNSGGRRMIGWPEQQDCRDLKFTDYVPAIWLPFFHETVLKTVREKGSWEGEMQLRNLQTGALVDVFRSTFLVRDPVTRAAVGFATVTRDITLAKKLERELLELSERERRQIGHDLHDGLGQHLHAVCYLSTLLQEALREERSPHASEAARLSKLLKQAATLTRGLAQGLQPVSPVPEGLMAALRDLAKRTRALYGVDCRLACRQPVHVISNAVATHLFRIAQEAINNAVKHAKPQHIQIALHSGGGRVTIGVRDDGIGIRSSRRARRGMGLHVMQHRANAIAGTLAVLRLPQGGTEVVCSIPVPEPGESDSPFNAKLP